MNTQKIKLKSILISFILGIVFASFILGLQNIWEITPLSSLKKALIENINALILFLINSSILIFCLKIFYKNKALAQVFNFCILITAFLLGIYRYDLSDLKPTEKENINFYNEKPVHLEGIIQEKESKISATNNKYQQLIIKPTKISISDKTQKNPQGKIMVYTDIQKDYDIGDKISFNKKIENIENFTPDFSYEKYLQKDNIYSIAFYPEITKTDKSHDFKYKFFNNLYDFKQKLIKNLESNIDDAEVAAFVTGVVLGDTEKLPQETKDNFSKTGLSHVMAVSGFNIAIIISVIYIICLDLLKIPRNISLLLASVLIILFVLLIGAPASAIRAAIMAIILMTALINGRYSDFITTILIAGALILWLYPKYLRYDIGFQLSFLAVLSLYYLYPVLENSYKTAIRKYQKYKEKEEFERLNLNRKKPHHKKEVKIPEFLKLFNGTLAAQLGTSPLIYYNFKRLSYIGPISNMIILPLIPFLTISGLILCFLGFINSTPASMLGSVVEAVGYTVLRLVEIMS